MSQSQWQKKLSDSKTWFSNIIQKRRKEGSKRLKPQVIGMTVISITPILFGWLTYTSPQEVKRLERQAQSLFFMMRGKVKPPPEIVILAIDDSSLQQGAFYDPKKYPYLEPFRYEPWKRVVYSQAIEKILKAGAKVIALDILFVSPSSHGTKDDQAMQQTIKKYGDRIIIAASYEQSTIGESSVLQLATPEDIYKISEASLGLINFTPDIDGTIRKWQVTLPQDLDLRPLPTFSQTILKSAKINYPKPRGNLIYFYGGDQTWSMANQQVPFYYVIDPENWRNDIIKNGQFFKDKIVLVGATAASKNDIKPFPLGQMPGIEIHANALASLMENRTIYEWESHSIERSILVVVLAILCGIGLVLLQRPLWQFSAALISSVIWYAAGYVSFIYLSFALPVVLPISLMLLQGMILLTTGMMTSQLDKRHLRLALERYVAGPIVNEIINQPEDYRNLLEGKVIKAAVLFSDIRGFTTLSSRLPAKLLIKQLNEYLSAMVDVILDYQGTIDKYIGDAIMAEFGSPISRGEKEDAMNAINAALAMRQALIKLRTEWQQNNKIPFSNGIGINYGEVTVGNIGSPRRLEYAVIGDTVNVASRVEGMTKELNTDIVITEALYRVVKDEVEVIDHGEHSLKGRAGAVRLYALVGLKGQDSSLHKQVQSDLQRHMALIKLLRQGELPS
ncbi:MAG: CHASE2 domain-containing protein [Pseudanabaenaceae cyanobacterium]